MGEPVPLAARVGRGQGLVVPLAGAAAQRLVGLCESSAERRGIGGAAAERRTRNPLWQRGVDGHGGPPPEPGKHAPPPGPTAKAGTETQKRFLTPFLPSPVEDGWVA